MLFLEETPDAATWLAGIKDLRGILEFAAKLAGAYVPGPPVVIELTFAGRHPGPRAADRRGAGPMRKLTAMITS